MFLFFYYTPEIFDIIGMRYRFTWPIRTVRLCVADKRDDCLDIR